MPKVHIIQAGEWLGALAKRYGFAHGSQIWDHPLNDSLRATRGTPDLLMRGDALQIPDAPAVAGVEVMSGMRAVFVLRAHDVLRLRVAGLKPVLDTIGPVAFELRVGARSVSGDITDDGQVIELPLLDTDTTAQLSIMGRVIQEIEIGGLGPAGEAKGAFDRLQSLGYAVERVRAGESQAASDPLATALVRFQRKHGLAETGVLDPATAKALVDEYGA